MAAGSVFRDLEDVPPSGLPLLVIRHAAVIMCRRTPVCGISDGCGSTGGASRRVRNDVAGVAGLVNAVAFPGEVVRW